MKDVDETPLPENEREPGLLEVFAAIKETMLTYRHKILDLEKRIVNLEQRKVANENNQKDPEWY